MIEYINLKKTPLGNICIAKSPKGLKYITIGAPNKNWEKSRDNILLKTHDWLTSYFRGSIDPIPDIELDEEDTDFRIKVWKKLRTIPYGKTASYSDIAKKMNKPMSYRAVGQANKHNPLLIYTPCHRIIGKNSLGGFSSGGIKNKKILLSIENAI